MQYFPLITKNSQFEKIMDNHRQAAAQKCTKMKKGSEQTCLLYCSFTAPNKKQTDS